jgi:hypothetical protein
VAVRLNPSQQRNQRNREEKLCQADIPVKY